MKNKSRTIQILCTLLFVFGILTGALIHNHIWWSDVLIAIVLGGVFYFIQVMSINFIFNKIITKCKGLLTTTKSL